MKAIAELTGAGIPLAGGLAAYGKEAPTWGVRRSLREISRSLENGASLEDALAGASGRSAAYVNGLVAAGVRSGRLAEALERHLAVIQRTQEIRSRVRLSLGYPLMLCFFALIILWVMLVWPVRDFKEIFEGFEVPLPSITITLFALSDLAVQSRQNFVWVLIILIVIATGVWSIRFLPGRSWRVRLFQFIPAIGTSFQYAGLSEFCSLLSILTACEIPLPEALRMGASAMRDANLREGSLELAERVEKGAVAEDEVRLLHHFPNSLSSLFRWSERNKLFSESLRTAGELYAAQARLQSGVVGVIVQPILLVAITVPTIGAMYLLFMPLIALLQSLT